MYVYSTGVDKSSLSKFRTIIPPKADRRFLLASLCYLFLFEFYCVIPLQMDAIVAAAVAAAPIPATPQRTSTEQRWSVVCLFKHGERKSHIALELGISRNTVLDILRRYDDTRSPLSGARTGRPRILDKKKREKIVAASHEQPFDTPRAIRRKLQMPCSTRTIDRTLQEAGLFGRIALHKRDYNAEELRKRLSFADYEGIDWTKVLFSDEKIFWGYGHNGRVVVRRPVGESLNPKYCAHKQAHPVKLNVWACFSAYGQGAIEIFKDTMDAAKLRGFLKKHLKSVGMEHFCKERMNQWYFLHDNAATFRSKDTTDWMFNNGIQCLDLPPYSPDLNPIENLWSILAEAVEQYEAEDVEQLEQVIMTEWKNLKVQTMAKLATSMPARCAVVKLVKGWHTKY